MHVVTRFSANLLLVVLSTILFAVATTAHGADGFITVARFKEDLRSKNYDVIIESFNTIKRMRYKGEILPFIRDLWDFREDRYPELPWDVIRLPVMRVEVADVLLQARRNRLIEIDDAEVRSFVKEMLKSDDVQVKSHAIRVLGITDDPEDVPLIFKLGAETENPTVFRSVVVTLVGMCSEEAKDAFDELEAGTANENWKTYLHATRKQHEDFLQRTDGAWCGPRR